MSLPPSGPHNPYAVPQSNVLGPNDSSPAELADRGMRLAAYLLDSIFAILVCIPILVSVIPAVIQIFSEGENMSREEMDAIISGSMTGIGPMITFVLGLGLFILTLILLHRGGQTLAKKILGIRIVRPDGSRASLGRIILLRYIVPGLIGAIPFRIGTLAQIVGYCLIFREDRRCLHDMIADTIVVKT